MLRIYTTRARIKDESCGFRNTKQHIYLQVSLLLHKEL